MDAEGRWGLLISCQKGSQMKTTLMTSALAITAVLAYGTIAAAQDAGPVSVVGESLLLGSQNGNDNSVDDSNNSLGVDVADSLNDNSTNDSNNDNSLDVGIDVADSLNDNSTDYDESFNDESDNSNNAEDSFNDNSDNSTDYDDSFNDESDNSNNAEDSFNDNSDNSTDYDDSFNDESDNSTNYDESFNSSTEDSYNTDNSQMHLALSVQILNASISDVGVNMGNAGLFGGDANGDINTGAISQEGGAFAAFAGIQTVSNNTGLASSGQAATAISANANVTFGDAH